MSEDSSDYTQALTPWILHQDFDFQEESQLPQQTESESKIEEAEILTASPEVEESIDPSKTEKSSSTANVQSESDSRARRRVQNRVAQRAFRERKQSYAKDLESKVLSAEERVQRLTAEKNALQHVLQQAKAENEKLQQQASEHPKHPIASVLLDWKARRHKDDPLPPHQSEQYRQ